MNVTDDGMPPGWARVIPADRGASDGWAHQHRSDGRYWVHLWGSECDLGTGPGVVHVRRILIFAKPPTPDGELLPYPGRVEDGSGLRLGFACWRWRVWDDRAREARAAFQASIDANSQGEGDVWWERHLTTAMGKRALWQARMDRYT